MGFVKNFKKTAIIYDNNEISYSQLINYSKYFQSILDIDAGDRVVILSPNTPDLIFAFYGIIEKNAIAVNLDYTYDVDELGYALSDCTPKYILTNLESKDRVLETIDKYKLDIKIIYFDEVDYSKIIIDETLSINKPDDIDKTALILYTSGTTGNPKGVMLSFDNILSQSEELGKSKMYEESDRFLALLPMHHIFPLLGSALVPMHFGATIVFLKELNSENIKKALSKHKITMLLGIPKLYDMFYKGIKRQIDNSFLAKSIFGLAKYIPSQSIRKILFKKVHLAFGGHIKAFVSGGAKLPYEVGEGLHRLGFPVIEGYGLTETSPMISFTRLENVKIGYPGQLLDSVTVKISNGEILAKGRNIMKGYYNKPDATKEIIDEEGFFHTGDLGFLTADNFLKITGRKKEMIVLSNGKNIDPKKIEEKILAVSGDFFEEFAVIDNNDQLNLIGLPNFNYINNHHITNIYESVKWDIVDKYNITAHEHEKILNIKLLNHELPKTKLGKLRRFKLRDILNNDSEEKIVIDEPKDRFYKEIKDFVISLGKSNVHPDSHLELDMGLDSLEKIELIGFIENSYNIPINEDKLTTYPSIRLLAKYSKEKVDNEEFIEFERDKPLELPKSHIFSLVFKYIFSIINPFMFNLKVIGKENINSGPKIYVGNHQSYLDGFIISKALPNNILKDSMFLAKVKHFKSKLMKFIASRGNVILLDINSNLAESLELTSKALEEGKNIIIFPEGVRSRDGKLGEFKRVFAILSKRHNLPIVPFVINGAYKAFPANKKLPKRSKINLEFLKEINPSDYMDCSLIDYVRDRIKERLK